MQKQITLKLKPEEAAISELVHQLIAQSAGVPSSAVNGYRTLKQSIDARSRQQVWINLTLQAFINEPFIERDRIAIPLASIPSNAKTVIIIGAGPAGLFAA